MLYLFSFFLGVPDLIIIQTLYQYEEYKPDNQPEQGCSQKQQQFSSEWSLLFINAWLVPWTIIMIYEDNHI